MSVLLSPVKATWLGGVPIIVGKETSLWLLPQVKKQELTFIIHAMLLAIGCCFRCACFHTPIYDIGAGSGVMWDPSLAWCFYPPARLCFSPLACHFMPCFSFWQRATSNFHCSLFGSMTCMFLSWNQHVWPICKQWVCYMFANTKMVNQQVHNPHNLFVNSIRCIVRQQCLTACGKWTSRRRPTRFSPMLTFLGGTGRPDFFHLHGLLSFDERVVSHWMSFVHSFHSFISRVVFFPTFLHSIYKFYNISISYTKWCLFTSLPTSHIRKLAATRQSCCFRFVLQLGRLGICESSLRINMHTPTKNTKKTNMSSKNDGFPRGISFCRGLYFQVPCFICVGCNQSKCYEAQCIGLNIPTL